MLKISSDRNNNKKVLWIALLVLLIGIAAEFIAIMILNSGHLVYTLDDAYIHLAMAENIAQGYYGVNSQDFSAPCSSILWPFILAPLAGMTIGHWAPLIINIISALGTMFLFWKIITQVFKTEENYQKNINTVVGFFLLISIPVTNLIGLIFTGMEHSLQVFFTVLVVWGVIREIESKKIFWWLSAALILGPLIRYENLAISLPVLLYFFFRGYRKILFLISGFIVLVMGGFSVFLLSLGLKILPTSILTQSSIFQYSGIIKMFLAKIAKSTIFHWVNSRNFFLIIAVLILFFLVLRKNRKKEDRLLAGMAVLAITMHIFFGNYGLQNRNEIYVWTLAILFIIYLLREKLSEFLAVEGLPKLGLIAILWAVLLSGPYIWVSARIPLACNNIYEQQYHMHLFAVNLYKKNVAVNDLGYVSYRNKNYVLDLFGLASLEAYYHRRNDESPDWMDRLSKTHNVKFAMIYDLWFNGVPDNWYKVGELHLGKERITPASKDVSFYAMDVDTYLEVYELLPAFQKMLPEGVKFTVSFPSKFLILIDCFIH